MSTTMESASASEIETNEEGTQIKGKDFIYLNAPAIDFPENAPLHNTDKRELYAILDELFQSGSGGGDEWSPPEWWIPVPEPQAYEIYLLVDILDTSGSSYGYEGVHIEVTRPADANTGHGSISIDWGDGDIFSSDSGWLSSNLSHRYTDTGQYLIKITATEQSCFLQRIDEFRSLLIAKLGSGIIINNAEESGADYYTQAAFYGKARLCMVKINGDGVLPLKRAFYSCYALKKVEMLNPPAVIGENAFANCRSLTKFDFSQVKKIEGFGAIQNAGFKSIALPKCTYIGDSGLQNNYSLQSIDAPICTSVGSNAFIECYALEKAVFADDCVFGSDCFENCYSLYPRPDGSIR